ncbi:superoxide dismutase [Paenibacillus albicereus]|uniref:superoxide dismutase n=1 Tax=Paenibacillus albicereus TaxID=2726185 RepID=A0A6H2H223_9BACL|nr:superoxide dismutase [Paenibacillus albicereus]QJC53649.1 superoxide dismutase [Paenibacillus albicereus]
MTQAPSDLAQPRLLKEIKQWKQEEADRLEQILLAAELEPAYAGVLQQWQPLLERTAAEADRLLEARSQTQGAGVAGEPAELLEAAAAQSGVLVQQLLQLLAASPALGREPQARSAVHEALRSSTACLARAEALRQGVEAAEPEPFEPRKGGAGEPAASTSEPPARAEAPPRTGHDGGAMPQVPIGGHKLPPLPYAYNALEPYIDEATMRIHHDKHHQTYVDDLNKAEKELQAARKSGDFALVKHWERELAFNGAGHYLHTLFWPAMSPQGGGKPVGALADEIDRSFGSFDAFKKQFSEAAAKVEGGGWTILVYSPRSRRLEILQAEKHQNLSQWDAIPLLPIDVWEHAYYLKHQNKRPDYIKDWWNVVNWPYVSERFEKARTLAWEPY